MNSSFHLDRITALLARAGRGIHVRGLWSGNWFPRVSTDCHLKSEYIICRILNNLLLLDIRLGWLLFISVWWHRWSSVLPFVLFGPIIVHEYTQHRGKTTNNLHLLGLRLWGVLILSFIISRLRSSPLLCLSLDSTINGERWWRCSNISRLTLQTQSSEPVCEEEQQLQRFFFWWVSRVCLASAWDLWVWSIPNTGNGVSNTLCSRLSDVLRQKITGTLEGHLLEAARRQNQIKYKAQNTSTLTPDPCPTFYL